MVDNPKLSRVTSALLAWTALVATSACQPGSNPGSQAVPPQAGPLPSNGGYDDYLGDLPPLRDLNGDGFRFVANPTFSSTRYGLSISRPTSTGEMNGMLNIYTRHPGQETIKQSHRFYVNLDEYLDFSSRIDRIMINWDQETRACTDGTFFAFERVRGEAVNSGTNGRTGCGGSHQEIAEVVRTWMKLWLPESLIPLNTDWSTFIER